MTGTEWLLSLHVLSAVVLGAAMTAFWALIVADVGHATSLRVSRPLTVGIMIGTLGTLVFGIWLAIVEDRYHVWDGWVIAAIVLWAAASELGRRAGAAFVENGPNARRNGIAFHAVSSVAVVVILVLMLWKPGA
jgi:hypothetical protein